jgi:chemotaxis protein MotA
MNRYCSDFLELSVQTIFFELGASVKLNNVEPSMKNLPIGFILTSMVIYLSMSEGSWRLYVNIHAMVLVVAGTATILVMSTPADALRNLWKAVMDAFKETSSVNDLKGDFAQLVKTRSLTSPSKNPLINYAADLWEQGTEPELFIVLVSQRRDEFERGYIDAVQALRNLAKYPPALGMTGTVMGLVSLFSVLGRDKAALGPSLALAMTATFFGLVVSNCIVTPTADHLHVKHLQNEKLFTSVYQLLILINRGEAASLVKDEVTGRAAA